MEHNMFMTSFESSSDQLLEEIKNGSNKTEDQEVIEEKERSAEDQDIIDQFNLDDALNNQQFLDFLSKYPDAGEIEMSEGNEELAERFLTFTNAKTLSGSMRTVFAQQIELESGVNTYDKLDSVDGYLSNMAIENVGRFNVILESKRKFEKSISDIHKTQAEIREVLGESSAEEIEQKVEDLSRVKKFGFIKMLFSGEARKEKRDVLEAYGIDKKQLDNALHNEEVRRESLEILRDIQGILDQRFKDAYQEMLSNEFEPLNQARDMVLEKIWDDFATVRNEEAATITDIDNIAQQINRIKSSGDYDKNNVEALEKYLQHMATNIISQKMDVVSQSGSKSLKMYEHLLGSITSKMTDQGLNTPEYKNLILQKMTELAKAEKDMSKKLLLKRIIVKLRT